MDHIFQKLGVRSRAELAHAVRHAQLRNIFGVAWVGTRERPSEYGEQVEPSAKLSLAVSDRYSPHRWIELIEREQCLHADHRRRRSSRRHRSLYGSLG